MTPFWPGAARGGALARRPDRAVFYVAFPDPGFQAGLRTQAVVILRRLGGSTGWWAFVDKVVGRGLRCPFHHSTALRNSAMAGNCSLRWACTLLNVWPVSTMSSTSNTRPDGVPRVMVMNCAMSRFALLGAGRLAIAAGGQNAQGHVENPRHDVSRPARRHSQTQRIWSNCQPDWYTCSASPLDQAVVIVPRPPSNGYRLCSATPGGYLLQRNDRPPAERPAAAWRK